MSSTRFRADEMKCLLDHEENRVDDGNDSRDCDRSLLRSKLFISSTLVLFLALLSPFCRGIISISYAEVAFSSEKWNRHLKKKKNKKEDVCKKESYSKSTAKIAFELPFVALFGDAKNERKFEASGLVIVDGVYYAICDNSWAISKFSPSLTPFSDDNIMIGDPKREEEDSGYEAILYNNNIFYVIRESVKHRDEETKSTKYHAIIEELVLNGGEDYIIKDKCKCEFEFEGTSKGFEGGFGMTGTDGEFYLVGLCEGNHCSESKYDDKGNGKMVLMKKNECLWETVRVIDIPTSASFSDYSDMSVQQNGKVAITSQEDSALWIGMMVGIEDGKLDPDTLEFDHDDHDLYNFPKSETCKTIYCNIEGIAFINDDMVMSVSDKMKSRGKQPHHCLEKDQSIHAFVLP